MLSDEIRKSLKSLNRAPLHRASTSTSSKITQGASLDKRSRNFTDDFGGISELPEAFRKPTVIRAQAAPFIRLNEAIIGEEVHNSRGRFLIVKRGVEEFTNGQETINSKYAAFLENFAVPSNLKHLSRQLRLFLGKQPSRILYLDIETTGLWSTPLFLVGLMFMDAGELRIHQLFAREYAEEAAVLEYLSEYISGFDSLITFNGKSFDIRFIRDRSGVNMVNFKWDGAHLDLLHEGRRRYRKKFENCRLVTLEQRLCGRLRTGDIPGHEIPDEYHNFVRTGNAWRLRSIFYHNGLDLITMAELLQNILSFEE